MSIPVNAGVPSCGAAVRQAHDRPVLRLPKGRAASCAALAAACVALVAAGADARTKGGGEIMTNEKVIALSKAGFAEDIIVRKIKGASRTRFDLTVEQGMVQLKAAGVSDEVVRVMLTMDEEESKVRDRRIRFHIEMLRSNVRDDYQRAVRVLVREGAYAVPQLLQKVVDEDERVRAGVCEVLGRIGDPPALEPLMEALLDRNAAVRAKAAKAISLFDRSEVLPQIEKAIARRGIPRDGYALALGYIGDIKHRETLIDITDSPGPESDRAAAAYSLSLLGDASAKAVGVLIDAMLSDTYRELREAAARALGHLAEKMEPALRTEVGLAMSKAAERYETSRAILARELRHFPGRRTVETLLAYLEDRDQDVSTVSWESLKAATGETMPRDAGSWQSWWEIAQLQARWQGERFLPSSTGDGTDLLPGPEDHQTDEEGAGPEAGLEVGGAADEEGAAPDLGITAPAPEDPFAR
jgi:hypothetical protein